MTNAVFVQEAVLFLAYLLTDGAKEVFEALTTVGLSTDAHALYGTWTVVIHALITWVLANTMSQEGHDLVIRGSQRLEDDGLEFETQCFRATRQCNHIFTAAEKASCYVLRLKLSTYEEVLEGLRRMDSKFCSSIIDKRRIEDAK